MNKFYKRRTISIVIVVICLIISFSFLLIDYFINNEEQLLWGKSTSDFIVNYKVYNKDNKFYTDDNMDEYDSYVTSITDKIDFDIKYYFRTTDNLDINYSYNIDGEVVAEVYESGVASPVWSKNLDVDVKETSKLGDSNYLQINKTVSIPFKEYNDMMIEYKNNYSINIDSYIKLTMNVNINSLANVNSNISNQDTLVIKVPLLQPTYTVELDKKVTSNKDIYLKTIVEKETLFFKIGVIGFIYTFVVSLVLFVSYKKSKSKYMIFIEKRNNVLKKYEEIIIKVDELPSSKNLEIIEISDFNDLIDLEQTLNTPIMYKYIESSRECLFVIVDKKYFYRYKFNVKNIND